MTEADITQLVKKAQKGDTRAFEQVIEQYYTKIYNIALGTMGNPHDAEDAAQNALIKIYGAIGEFRFKSKFSTWVYRVAMNSCRDELRKRKRVTHISSEEIGESDFGADIQSPETYALKSEASIGLRDAIDRLKDEHKTAIVLRDINGFSYEEIARITKCSVGTVKSRISRARTALKDLLVDGGYFQ